jgi:hypothetical protein
VGLRKDGNEKTWSGYESLIHGMDKEFVSFSKVGSIVLSVGCNETGILKKIFVKLIQYKGLKFEVVKNVFLLFCLKYTFVLLNSCIMKIFKPDESHISVLLKSLSFMFQFERQVCDQHEVPC